MDYTWAKSHGYGCWGQHRNMRDVSHVKPELITNAKVILKQDGKAVDVGGPEDMGYLLDGDFVVQRRIWSDGDLYPQLKLYSESEDKLERLADSLGLPLPFEQ